MRTFQERITTAVSHEQAVADAIRACGWTVGPFGQALLPGIVRERMKLWDNLLRHFPDLIAVRERHGPDDTDDGIRLVDAKAGRTDTDNYDFQDRAVLAYQRWVLFDIDVWLVFPDLRCARASDAWTTPQRRRGHFNGTGSGTAFSLLPKCDPCVMSLAEGFGP